MKKLNNNDIIPTLLTYIFTMLTPTSSHLQTKGLRYDDHFLDTQGILYQH